jgi:hypothetical protein
MNTHTCVYTLEISLSLNVVLFNHGHKHSYFSWCAPPLTSKMVQNQQSQDALKFLINVPSRWAKFQQNLACLREISHDAAERRFSLCVLNKRQNHVNLGLYCIFLLNFLALIEFRQNLSTYQNLIVDFVPHCSCSDLWPR